MTTKYINPKNTLLTGPARSGTTLTCSLLNQLPNCVALNEPMLPDKLARLAPETLIAKIGRFFDEQRVMILRKGKATSKSLRGRVPTNPLGEPDASGIRKNLIDGRELVVDNVTGPDFSLFIKHPAFFTAALPVLSEGFACFAIVRDPLAVLVSWQNCGMAIEKGRIPAAEKYDLSLAAKLAAEPDMLERQLIILDYCFNRYLTYLPDRILRYEDVIASGGKVLALLDPAASRLDEPLQSRNQLFLRRNTAISDIAKRLVTRESPCWKLYDRTAMEEWVR